MTCMITYSLLPLLQLLSKSEALYEEISGALQSIEQKSLSGHELSARNELHNRIMELKEQLIIERNNYNVSMQFLYMSL